MPSTKGQKPHRGKQVTTAEFRRMWFDPDLTVEDIAKALDICRFSVWQRAQSRGMPDRTGLVKPGPKPALDTVAEAMWRACVRGEDIAALYGVNVCAVHQHVHRNAIERGRRVDRWQPAISLEDYRAMQLRIAMEASARVTAGAMLDAEMVDGDTRLVKWAPRKAA